MAKLSLMFVDGRDARTDGCARTRQQLDQVSVKFWLQLGNPVLTMVFGFRFSVFHSPDVAATVLSISLTDTINAWATHVGDHVRRVAPALLTLPGLTVDDLG